MKSLKDLPKSPITGINNVAIVETFSSADIIKLYRQQEEMNVEKYFENYEEIYILECERTGYRFYYPFELIGDASFYENLRNSEYDRDEADDHKFAYEQIDKDAKLLEIGCGTGKFLENIANITKNVSGLELNPMIARSASEKGFDVKNQMIEEHAEEYPNSYDVICAFQVLEHIAQVKSFLDAALKLLKRNGKLIFSVPNNEPFFQRFSKYEVLNLPPHHMGLWGLKAFQNLSKVFDMSLEKHAFTAQSGFKADAYLRAKLMADVKSLPRKHSTTEKIKILAVSPFAVTKSALDQIKGKKNNAHISVVFVKN